MVKRLKDIAATSADSKLADTVRDSAHQIWLAGLGAFGKAQEEGVKVFDALVKEGKGIEAKTRKLTEQRLDQVTEQVNKAAHSATSKANAAWDKLEQVFEDRVARSLNRLGVPTNKDIRSLSRRVEELSAAVTALRAMKPKVSKSRAKSPAKKVASKRKAG